MDEVVKRAEIFIVPLGVSIKGEVFHLQQKNLDPGAPYCSGCQFKTNEGIGCNIYYTSVDNHFGDSLLIVINDITEGCWYKYPTTRVGYVWVKAPEEVVEPGENGWVPDTFLPGPSIHEVTRLLCK